MCLFVSCVEGIGAAMCAVPSPTAKVEHIGVNNAVKALHPVPQCHLLLSPPSFPSPFFHRLDGESHPTKPPRSVTPLSGQLFKSIPSPPLRASLERKFRQENSRHTRELTRSLFSVLFQRADGCCVTHTANMAVPTPSSKQLTNKHIVQSP